MDTRTKEIYSEVYSILNMLGEDYIKKLPNSLLEMIKESKSNSYRPIYDINIGLDKQQIRRESLSMIALFHLNYWCNSNDEKDELKRILKSNEDKYQAKLREKYNPDEIFKNRKKNTQQNNIASNLDEVSLMKVDEPEGLLKKIKFYIKHILEKIRKL